MLEFGAIGPVSENGSVCFLFGAIAPDGKGKDIHGNQVHSDPLILRPIVRSMSLAPIGYTISGEDNGGYFLRNAPDGTVCPNCGTCFDYGYAPSNLKIVESGAVDMSSTYDNRHVFSRRFVDLVTSQFSEELSIRQVSQDPDGFYVLPNRIVPFDPVKRKTRFENPCGRCGGFESVVGATPAYLRIKELPGRGMFRSDLAFGSGLEKYPLTIVDRTLRGELDRQQFQGLVLREVWPLAGLV